MKKTKKSKKNNPKKTEARATKKAAAKSKLAAKKAPVVKAAAKSKAAVAKSALKPAMAKSTAAPKSAAVVKTKVAPKKKARRVLATLQVGSQDVETVRAKPKARVARAGAGGGDFGGASLVEGAGSESVDELLQEGQAFEAGI